jgi:hypothetical protein
VSPSDSRFLVVTEALQDAFTEHAQELEVFDLPLLEHALTVRESELLSILFEGQVFLEQLCPTLGSKGVARNYSDTMNGGGNFYVWSML